MGPRELIRIERLNGLFAGLLILASAIFFSTPVLIGVAVGAVLAVVNFWGVRRLVQASLRTDGPRRAALQLLLIGKMGVLFLLVFLAIRFLPLHPVGLAVGMSVFLISIAVESARFALSGGSPEAHDGRA
jgi:amino acid transporter